MILVRAKSHKEVEEVIKDPELFARIAEDGISDFKVDMSNCYLLMKKDDITIGVWCLYPSNRSTLNVHCNILKEYRNHGAECRDLFLDWFRNECPKHYVKLNAEIPMIYPEVYYYTKKAGFQDEGINRQSICKDGVMVDQWRLGITREEVG